MLRTIICVFLEKISGLVSIFHNYRIHLTHTNASYSCTGCVFGNNSTLQSNQSSSIGIKVVLKTHMYICNTIINDNISAINLVNGISTSRLMLHIRSTYQMLHTQMQLKMIPRLYLTTTTGILLFSNNFRNTRTYPQPLPPSIFNHKDILQSAFETYCFSLLD